MLYVAIVAVVLIVVVQIAIDVKVQAKRFEEFKLKWPSINDDEFVRKCSPDINPKTALKVRRIISQQLGIPYEHIHPGQSFGNDLDF